MKSDPTSALLKELRRMTSPRRERDLQTAVLALLRAHGIPCWKTGSGGFRVGERYVKMGQKGMADVLAIVPVPVPWSAPLPKSSIGQFCAIELKDKGKKPTLEQLAFLHTVRKAGGIGFVAYSTEDVRKELGL